MSHLPENRLDGDVYYVGSLPMADSLKKWRNIRSLLLNKGMSYPTNAAIGMDRLVWIH